MNPNNLAEDIRALNLTEGRQNRLQLQQAGFHTPEKWRRRQSLKSATPHAWLWGGVALVVGIILFGLAKGWK